MSTLDELKAEYYSAIKREKDLYTEWRSKELLIAYAAIAMAESKFKDDPAFDYIRLLAREAKETQALYSEQTKITSAAFDRYQDSYRTAPVEASDVH